MFSGIIDDQPKAKNEQERQAKVRLASEMKSEIKNPCIKVSNFEMLQSLLNNFYIFKFFVFLNKNFKL